MNPYWNLNLEMAIPMAIVGALFLAVTTWLLTRRRSGTGRWLAWRSVISVLLVLNPLSNWDEARARWVSDAFVGFLEKLFQARVVVWTAGAGCQAAGP